MRRAAMYDSALQHAVVPLWRRAVSYEELCSLQYVSACCGVLWCVAMCYGKSRKVDVCN